MSVQKFTASRRVAADAVIFAIGLWLAGPLSIAKMGGLYDDYLFVRLANFLLQGRWLGPFDQLTLAKGPFYPLFLAGAVALGVPVQFAVETVYLLGALLLCRVAGALSGRPAIGTLCFALVALNPACTDWSTTMLMREPLYCGLTLLVLGLCAKVLLCGARSGWPLCLGAAAAAYWLTREEGVVLAPPVLLMLAWYFRAPLGAALSRLRRRPFPVGRSPKNPAWPPAVAAFTALSIVLAVCAINQHVYGVFRSNDFQTGPFPRAYGALARIIPAHWQRLTPISREARQQAYAVSPAFAELRPFIEANTAHLDIDVECDVTPRPACHDIPGQYFMWALRDAVTRAGYYGTAKRADRFYRRLAREIDGACARGALNCTGPRSGYLPPLRMADGLPLLRSLGHAAMGIAWLGGANPLNIFSQLQGNLTPAYDTLAFGTPVNPPQIYRDAPGWQISGAISSTDPAAQLAVAAPQGVSAQSDLRVRPDQNVNVVFHHTGPTAEDFDLDLRCPTADCSVTLIADGRAAGSWTPASLHPGAMLDTPQALLYINSITPLPSYAALENAPRVRTVVLRLSAHVLPYLTGLGALPILAWVAWRVVRRPCDALTILAAALVLGILTRIGMLGLLEATSIPLEPRYEAPAMGPLLCLAGLMLGDLAGKLPIR